MTSVRLTMFGIPPRMRTPAFDIRYEVERGPSIGFGYLIFVGGKPGLDKGFPQTNGFPVLQEGPLRVETPVMVL